MSTLSDDILRHCIKFVKAHPIDEDMIYDDHIDAQYFFESIDNADLLTFFDELYHMIENE